MRQFLCGVFLFLASQGAARAEDIRFDRISIEQGLSASMVTCILQDSVGYIWIGTADGLNRYDGKTFTIYRHLNNDPYTLTNNLIFSLHESQDGKLWVGTQHGLNLYDRARDRFIRFEPDPDDRSKPSIADIATMASDAQGDLWLGSMTEGVNILDADTHEFLRLRAEGGDIPGLASNQISRIQIDDDKTVWIMSWSRVISIYDLNTKTFSYLNTSIEFPGRVSGFIKTDADTYWLGTNEGIIEYNATTGDQRLRFSDPQDPGNLPESRVISLHKDSYGRIWVCTRDGVAIYEPDNDEFHIIQHDPTDPTSISINLIETIMEDRSGAIWIGTRGKGINLYSPTKYKFLHLNQLPENSNSLQGNYIYSILEDSHGILWVGTYEGYLNRIDFTQNSFQAFDFRSNNRDTAIFTLLQWTDDEVFAGLYYGGIQGINTRTGSIRKVVETEDITSAILRSSDGKLYVALRTIGLKVYDQKPDRGFRLEKHIKSPDIVNQNLYCLAEADSFIWAGSINGLHRYSPADGKVHTYFADGKRGNLTNDNILHLTTTTDGTLWIGTRGGLNRYDPETDSFIGYTVSDGLPNDVIYSILEDSKGNLWLGTNKGLLHWDPIEEVTLKQYLQEDGLQSNEFNTGACYKSPSGRMFFGGVNGVSIFEPESIKINETPPPVVITSISIFGDRRLFDMPYSLLDRIQLQHDENFIELEFAALDFTNPGQNQYMYRLSGLDPDWVIAGNRNFASYNLNPGTYEFLVRGSNSDGIWNEEETSLEIVINPPYWGTWWFLTLVTLLGASLIWVLFMARTRIMRSQRDKLREEVARRTVDLRIAISELETFSYTVSHDLRAPIRNLQGYCELLSVNNEKQSEQKRLHYVSRIRENAERMEDLINDILWLSRASNAEIVNDNIDLSAMASDIFAELKQNQPEREVIVSIEQNIQVRGDYRLIRVVMDNLIGNAWKFSISSDPARIELSTEVIDGNKVISLSDNGIGFEKEFEEKIFEPFQKLHSIEEYEGTGIGLATVKKVITRHQGRIWAKSIPGKGTSFYIMLP